MGEAQMGDNGGQSVPTCRGQNPLSHLGAALLFQGRTNSSIAMDARSSTELDSNVENDFDVVPRTSGLLSCVELQ